MTSAQLFYAINLLIYAGVDIIACLGLSQQFGVAGVTNFGYIIFQAAGAYTAAILSLPRQSANGGFQSYIGGWNLPLPIPWIGAMIVGGLLALPFTFLVGRRLRGDFAAVGLLVTAVMANLLVNNYRPLLNGSAGLSLVPAPLQSKFNPQSQGYQWLYAAVTLVLAAAVYLLVRRVTESPYGRSLRAMRDNDIVADSLGKNLLSLRAAMLVLGGALAALSGAILVGFINLWAPSAWGYAETIVLFAAVIIGGAGSHRGAVLGAILVPVGFEEATRYIPQFGPPGLVDDLQWVAIGLLIVVFLWFRPQGVLPERRRRIGAGAPPEPIEIPNEDVVTLAGLGRAPGLADAVGQDGSAVSVAGRPITRSVPSSVERGRGRDAAYGGRDPGLRRRARRGRGIHRSAARHPDRPHRSQRRRQVDAARHAGRHHAGHLGAGDLRRDRRHRRARLPPRPAGARPDVPAGQRVQAAHRDGEPAQRGARSTGETRWSARCAGAATGGVDEEAAIARARALLDRFGLSGYADTYAGDLSGGQRRLTEIMRALMAEPAVLLLDEPMAGVHPRLARQIGAQLLGLCAEGMTILMVEHELAIMDEFCDPVIVMAEGTVLATGTMAALRARTEVVEAYLVG